jgi:transcriptional regulator with XRE-family HTH domain
MKMEELRRIRRAKEISQKDLAERAGLSRWVVVSAENGQHTPHYENLVKLADALSVDVEEILPKGAAPRSESDTEGTPLESSAKRSSTHIMPKPGSPEDFVTLEVDLLARALKAVEAGIVAADEAEEKLLDLGQHDWVPREEASAEGIS